MRLCFFEDTGVYFLEPIALTRPAFSLRCGVGTILQRQSRIQQPEEIGAVVRPHLADLCRLQYPAVITNDRTWWEQDDTVYVNARWFPPLEPIGDRHRPHVGMVGEDVAYVIGAPPCPGGEPEVIDEWLETCRKRLPYREAGGVMLHYLWHVVDLNGETLRQDFDWFRTKHQPELAANVAVVGDPESLVVAEGAHVDPFVMADTREGPVLIDRGAVIHSFSRLEGPCYIGKNSWVLGAKIRMDTSIGPMCRIGGEVEASIVHAYSNKYHEGFLGHSYVGRWVNLAAGTHTSDLRNDYGVVRTTINGQRLATGRTKVGSYLGDHTKTGLGVLLNTGSVVGMFANVLPSGSLLPQIIPSFCQVRDGEMHERWDLRQSFSTAATVMRRRGQELTDVHRDLYFHLYDQTAELRQQTIREAEQRRLRKSVL